MGLRQLYFLELLYREIVPNPTNLYQNEPGQGIAITLQNVDCPGEACKGKVRRLRENFCVRNKSDFDLTVKQIITLLIIVPCNYI